MNVHWTPREERRTILVAGGAGFIGSHLCTALLANGDRVICLDNFTTGTAGNIAALHANPQFQLIEADARVPIEIAGKLHQIYNLTCPPPASPYSPADPARAASVVETTRNLLALAELHRTGFVQASTNAVYGAIDASADLGDAAGRITAAGPRDGDGRRAAEALCWQALRSGRVNVRVARIFDTYGPRMHGEESRIVSNFIMHALRGLPLTLYGTGQQMVSFCYVSDIIGGLIRLMEVRPNPLVPVDLGAADQFTVTDLAWQVLRAIPTPSRIVYETLPADTRRPRRPDLSRAKQKLGWEPRVVLAKGLPRTIEWFAHSLGEMYAREVARVAAARRA